MDLAERQFGYVAELEDFFRRRLVDRYATSSDPLWQRDHSSVEAYLDSVEHRRQSWRRLLAPPVLTVEDVEIRESWIDSAQWLVVQLEDGLTAQGALVVPGGATKLVVFQHGLGSTPERVFGLDDPTGAYGHVGQRLVEAGYAVLAPMNLIRVPARNRAQSLCRLGGTTMEGLEFSRLQCLLEAVGSVAPTVDLSGYALAGLSWGGLAAQYWSPLDDRVRATATVGFFNNRPLKMVVEDTRYSSFYATGGDHAFIHGLLLGFGDADLASLVCPRPFLVQHGRWDQIGWWPLVQEEYERARSHWEALGVQDRVDFQLMEAGHVVDSHALVQWLLKHFPAESHAQGGRGEQAYGEASG